MATPPLADPNFDRTVVYMLEHTATGALGLVVNRPTEEDRVDGLDEWCELLSGPPVVFSGGPVELDALIGLVWSDGSLDTQAWSAVADGIGTVDLRVEPNDVGPVIPRLRLFRGYSGWSPGQLDDELDSGAWMVLPAEVSDVFTPDPDELWRAVLRRQGGRMAWIANAPDDLSAN